MFECDKVIDGVSDVSGLSAESHPKLVILKIDKDTKGIEGKRTYVAVAVFNTWTFWRKIDDKAEQCRYCARYEVMVKGYCPRCGKQQLAGN
jgi:hypothetical protein